MNVLPPGVGDWYRTSGGGSASELFEVVAFDEADSTLEVQYFDGTIEELELSDWRSQCASGAIMAAEPPEDWSGAVDIEPEDGRAEADPVSEDRQLRADRLDGLDLFEMS